MSTTGETTSAAKDEAAQVAQTGKQEASAVAGTATAAAKDVAGTATEQAKAVAAEAQRQIRDLVGQAGEEVRGQASDQTQRLAQSVRGLAGELHSMAQKSDQQGPATDLVRQLAGKGHDLAGYLEGRQPERILDDIRSYARRRPGLFLLGAGLAGFLTARLVKGAKTAGESDSAASPRFEAYPAAPTELPSGYTGTGYATPPPYGTAAGVPITGTELDPGYPTATPGYVTGAELDEPRRRGDYA